MTHSYVCAMTHSVEPLPTSWKDRILASKASAAAAQRDDEGGDEGVERNIRKEDEDGGTSAARGDGGACDTSLELHTQTHACVHTASEASVRAAGRDDGGRGEGVEKNRGEGDEGGAEESVSAARGDDGAYFTVAEDHSHTHTRTHARTHSASKSSASVVRDDNSGAGEVVG